MVSFLSYVSNKFWRGEEGASATGGKTEKEGKRRGREERGEGSEGDR